LFPAESNYAGRLVLVSFDGAWGIRHSLEGGNPPLEMLFAYFLWIPAFADELAKGISSIK